MKKIKIKHKVISEESRPFIVAEVGVNYYDIAQKERISPFEAAKLMIKKAAQGGADAVKFQIYKAGKLASKFSPAYWDTKKEPTKSQYELFQKFDKLSQKKYRELAQYAKENNIIFMATPFDEEAVDLVNELAPVFKIASADITDFPLIKYIAQKGKPIFLSTGASTVEEIEEAVDLIRQQGNEQIALLHCVLNYPTDYKNANLSRIKLLQKKFPQHLIGYSDHTPPDKTMLVLTASALLGAKVIEKHFTLDKTLPGNDHYHAMDYEDLKKFIDNLILMDTILEKNEKPLEVELDAIKYARRSIVAAADLPKGTKISFGNLAVKRPGTGISPKSIDEIIGKITNRDIKEDEIIHREYLS